jgi:DNA polymerase-3 subunit beta
MIIKVKKQYVEYLSRFASKEEVRYYLNGVYFDKKDNALAATDGHRLGYIENAFTADSELPEDGYIIKFSKQALSFIKSFKYAEEIEIIIEEKAAVVQVWGASMSLDLIDGIYPDWRRVTKTEPEAVSEIGLDGGYLKDFVIKKPLKLSFNGTTAAICVEVSEIPEFKGLLMPCRV